MPLYEGKGIGLIEDTMDESCQPSRRYLLCNNDTMRKATRALTQLYDDVMAPSGLRFSQFSIMIHIHELDEPTIKVLGAELVMDQSALSHSLKPLIRDGFVRLVPNLTDGRSKRVTLTKAGQVKVDETRHLWEAAQTRMEAIYGEENARRLREALIMLASSDFAEAFTAAKTDII
jgi:DNA-binding MarR family transcriptional regulator